MLVRRCFTAPLYLIFPVLLNYLRIGTLKLLSNGFLLLPIGISELLVKPFQKAKSKLVCTWTVESSKSFSEKFPSKIPKAKTSPMSMAMPRQYHYLSLRKRSEI